MKNPFDLNDPEIKELLADMRKAAAQETVDKLNALLRHEPTVLHRLIETRFLCSEAVLREDCPAVPYIDEDGSIKLGLLGVLNGLMNPAGYRIVAHYDDAEVLNAFTLATVTTNHG